MPSALVQAVELAERFSSAPGADHVARLYFDALVPLGLRALYARSYPTRTAAVATETMASRQHTLARISPDGWEDAYARAKLDVANPVVRGVQSRANSFVWSEVGRPAETLSWPGWDALTDFSIVNGFGIPCHGAHGYCAAVSIGFESIDLSPVERQFIELSAVALHDRLRQLSPDPGSTAIPALTDRERDSLGFVADGKSDWDVGVAMGVSQTTAHAHIENAKRKLGARTRAQAVARAARLGII